MAWRLGALGALAGTLAAANIKATAITTVAIKKQENGDQQPQIAFIQLPDHHRVIGAMQLDIDGDGQPDLALACIDDSRNTRTLRLYLRQASGPAYTSKPSREPIAIDRDVIAFAFADCLPTAGPELLLLTAEQIAVLIPAADGTATYRRLARHRLVWPAADGGHAVPLTEAAVDFDGDGLIDLVLPSPDGWTVLFQDRNGEEPSFERRAEMRLPPWQSAIARAIQSAGLGSRESFALRFGDATAGSPASNGPLVSVSTRTPPCRIADIDGDGRLDLATQRNGKLFSAHQVEAGRLEMRERALPLPEDRLTVADPAFDVQLIDVDGDGRADLLLTTSSRRDDDIESRVDLFLTKADGSWADKPDSRLRLQALAGAPSLVDVDGDGRRDLACLSLRTASMRDFTGSAASSLDAQLSLFHNNGREFARPPLLTRPLPLAAGESRLARPFLLVRPGNGGPGDVLLHIDGGLERRPLEARGERLLLGEASGRVTMPQATADGAQAAILAVDAEGTDVLITRGTEVQHVRYER